MPLNQNHRLILDVVHELQFPDREQLTALCSTPPPPGKKRGFDTRGVEKALSFLVGEGYLSNSLRHALSSRAQRGVGRRRIIYYLTKQGRDELRLPPLERSKLTGRVFDLGINVDKMAHDSLAAWSHTLALMGHNRNLWSVSVTQSEAIEFSTRAVLRHIPDRTLKFQGPDGKIFPRYVEAERRNKTSKTLRHAWWYWEAYQAQRIDGRVLFVCEDEVKLRSLRAIVADDFSEVFTHPADSAFFLFLSRDQLDMQSGFKPLGTPTLKLEDLARPTLLTAGGKRAPLVPPPALASPQPEGVR